MDFEDIDILTLLPQRSPFIMIDKLLSCDKIFTKTRLLVRGDNIFVEQGRLTSQGLIENIAQTCAARMGYINQYIYKENIKLGFIGSIKNLQIARTPNIGETLETTIEVEEEVFQMTLVNATIKINDEVIVTSEMKIALSDIDSSKKE
jgi:predicted hotdog family 3-hydroxylacyl-ACP dehydratase